MEGFRNIVRLKIWIRPYNLRGFHAICHHVDNRSDWDTQVPNARHGTPPMRLGSMVIL